MACSVDFKILFDKYRRLVFCESLSEMECIDYTDVTEILAILHSRAGKMIRNGKRLHYGYLMDKALNYMLNGWNELQNYRMEGHYTSTI